MNLRVRRKLLAIKGKSMHKGSKSNNTEYMRKKRAEMDTGRRSKQPVSAGSEELWERTKVHCCDVREL